MSNTIINELIKNNEYIKTCLSCKEKDKNSLSYLIKRNMSQSDCIKLGNGYEKVLTDIIISFSGLKNIKEKNKKGKKERDHLFIDETNMIVYYAELKGNINLDTEKSMSTYMKCQDVVTELKKEYPDYKIRWCLLGYRYLDNKEIPVTIKKKYSPIEYNLFGINDYLSMLNIEHKFTQETYNEFLNDIADTMFNNS